MQLTFRILDTDIVRMKTIEKELIKLISRYGFDAKVCQVTEMLEHGRIGVADALPALEINDIIVSKGRDLTPDQLDSLFEKLYAMSIKSQEKMA